MLPAIIWKDNKRPSDPAFAGTGSIGRTLPVVAAWNRAARFGPSYHKETSTGQTVKIMLEAFWSPLRLKQTNLPEDRAEEKPWRILAFSRGERGEPEVLARKHKCLHKITCCKHLHTTKKFCRKQEDWSDSNKRKKRGKDRLL